MAITPEPEHRPRSISRRDDPVLYPVVKYREGEPASPGRWQRLREALAAYLTAPYEDDDRRATVHTGVLAYQQELAWRSRSVLRRRTREGWWLGPAPYGYTLVHHRVDGESGAACRRHRLIVDELRAPVVPLIFTWYLRDKLAERAIVRHLIEQQHPQPADPASGPSRDWSPAIVRNILNNPAYLGYVVRNRTLRGQDRPPECWTWSQQRCHRELVEPAAFWAVYNNRFRWLPAHPNTDNVGLNNDGREVA
ncbi:recombinase family protein [Amycolatopsis sp. H20-H5]|uniref:recombinase family protein n=1 Tax=Amycolatopsis sp. H20-H5 TaxID=3046309 RepID=UPI002DBE26E5|nr:recombinase family protein [Amycolatopsis sp. H20-H5]MEC3974353.1 recombinase family protein [Amycolatopsis sp. H20-H5]